MNDISLTRLGLADAPALMAFEIENRAWFEAWVPPRPDAYWHRDSLEAIIRELVEGPDPKYLIRKGPALAGRLNLSAIDGGTAQLGYRVGRAFNDRGIASRAVELGLAAASSLGLGAVEAQVKTDNPASARVLEKTGFDVIAAADGWRGFRIALTPSAPASKGNPHDQSPA